MYIYVFMYMDICIFNYLGGRYLSSSMSCRNEMYLERNARGALRDTDVFTAVSISVVLSRKHVLSSPVSFVILCYLTV